MKTRSNSRRFIPNLLSLEDRSVPAGNVTATLVGTTLQVYGDSADNNIVLKGGATPGSIEVKGVGTTVNGGTAKLSFTGIQGLLVNVADGDDTVRTRDLQLETVEIDGGEGNDDIKMRSTTLTQGINAASLSIYGDAKVNAVANGRDSIDVSGTRMSGQSSIFLAGDSAGDNFDVADAPDDIHLTDTKHSSTGGFLTFDVGILGGGGTGVSTDSAGDTITVADLRANVVGSTSLNIINLRPTGSAGADTFRLNRIGLSLAGVGGSSNSVDLYVDGAQGFDRLDVTDLAVSATGPANAFHYFTPYITCEDVRLRNWDIAVTGLLDFNNGRTPLQMYLSGVQNLKFRDARFAVPDGGGAIYIDTYDPYTGEDGDSSLLIDNVRIDRYPTIQGIGFSLYVYSPSGTDTVRIADSDVGDVGINTGFEGNGRVEIDHCDLASVYINTGEGNDTVRISDTTFYAGSVYGGYNVISTYTGDDTITISGCSFTNFTLDLYEGNDTLKLKNNTFDTLFADLGDGDDTAVVKHNTATTSLSVDGGGGFDSLCAHANVAPSLAFDNFED